MMTRFINTENHKMNFIMYGFFCSFLFQFSFFICFLLYFSSRSLSPSPLLCNSSLIPLESLGASGWSGLDWREGGGLGIAVTLMEDLTGTTYGWTSGFPLTASLWGGTNVRSQWRKRKEYSVQTEVEVSILKPCLCILVNRRTWLVGLRSAFSAV